MILKFIAKNKNSYDIVQCQLSYDVSKIVKIKENSVGGYYMDFWLKSNTAVNNEMVNYIGFFSQKTHIIASN